MDCKIKTITPVFIGSGNKLVPFEFNIENNNYYRYNLSRIFDLIYDLDPSLIDKFNNWVDITADKLERADNRTQPEIRRKFKIKDFLLENGLTRDKVTKILNDKKSSFYRFSLTESIGKVKELSEIQKNHDYTPFIPGSSVKGSIRTAIAYNAVLNFSKQDILNFINGISDSDIKGIKKELSDRNTKEKVIGSDLENIIFYLGKREGNRILYKDEKYDLFKALKISDTFEQKSEFDLFNVMIYKKSTGRNGEPARPQPMSLIEVIREDGIFELKINIDVEYLRKLRNLRDILDFDNKLQKSFGISVEDLLTKEAEEKIINFLKNSIISFSKKNVQRELAWLENNPNRVDVIKREYDKIKRMLDENRILLRVGFASGFFQTTVGLAMLENPMLKDQLTEVFIKYGLDLPQGIRREKRGQRRPIKFDKFPTSRRLIDSNFKPIFPLGWVELVF